MHKLTYQAPLRDMNFLLWEQFRIQDTLGFSSPQSREFIALNLKQAQEFSEGPLACSYRETDEQEAFLTEAGTVQLPDSYPALMVAYREIWARWMSAAVDDLMPPPILQNMMVEMFMSGNASFMTYVGFSQPGLSLLGAHGTVELNALYRPALEDLSATACLCITELEAGSDLTRLRALATRQEDGSYRVSGHKWLISAGSHELTDNIYYFVLCRTDPAQSGMVGLSCFLVPRYRFGADGCPSVDNGIRVRDVVQKMGFKGCANALITFSEEVPTEGYLLGEVEGRGLQQLMMMMKPARISTGIFALGLASSAYETAYAYSLQRIQGKRFDQSMSARAPSLPIAEHPDVRRMRLEMAAYTTGCRALLARLGHCQSIENDLQATVEERRAAIDISEVLLPLVKAYNSDSAWRVCETAIQTMGGVGFTRDYPAQQNARDCKVLSIWEGTNHIQALFLLRDKLGMCVRLQRLEVLLAQIKSVVACAEADGRFARQVAVVRDACEAVMAAAQAIGQRVCIQMNDVSEFAVEFQSALGDLVIAWHLLEAGVIARKALDTGNIAAEDAEFYAFKVETASFFVHRLLPRGIATARAIAAELQHAPEPFVAGSTQSA